MKLSLITKHIIRQCRLLPILYTNLYCNNNTLEHIYPVSYMKHCAHRRDIHNIFTTSNYLNQLRGNYEFNIIKKNKRCIIIEDNIICKENKTFCPRIQDRGIIARAMLYMRDTYNYTDFGNYTLYKEWNKQYKPTKKELLHNEFAYIIQGNRNKFIK